MNILHAVLSDDYLIATPGFMQQLGADVNNPNTTGLLHDHMTKHGQAMKSLMELVNREQDKAWQQISLECGKQVYVAQHGEASIKIALLDKISDTTAQKLQGDKVECYQEVEVRFETPWISYGFKWLFGAKGEKLMKAAQNKLVSLVRAGVSALITKIVAGVIKAAGVVVVMLQAMGVKAGVAGFIVKCGMALIAGGAFVGAIKIVAAILLFIGVFFLVGWLLSLLFQKLSNTVMVFNVTRETLKWSIPYMYNVMGSDDRNQMGSVLSPVRVYSQVAEGGIPVEAGTQVISFATIRFVNSDQVFGGMGEVIKVDNPAQTDGFQNVVSMTSIPLVGQFSLGIEFNNPRTSENQYYDQFNDESGNNTSNKTIADFNRFKAVKTVRETITDDGYKYDSNFIVADTSLF